jgi:ubiquinone/menaquinone biosynthesis C-methylase UbiE
VANPSEELIRTAGYGRAGFAQTYDRYRPEPPPALLDFLCRAAGVERPRIVVDLGCGTGLSTRAWVERAEEVVGVEPQGPMRARAEEATDAPNVRYLAAYSDATGLPDGCADVVTCSQSFHWMEPVATLAEAARILRAGGVFAAYDYDVPPFVHPEVDAAFERYLQLRREVRERRGIQMGAARWPKDEHLRRIGESGHFRLAREIVLHGDSEGGAERVVGAALSIGPVFEELDPLVEELRAVAARVLGDRVVPWHVGYRVRLGWK